jgi:hypothetical protein
MFSFRAALLKTPLPGEPIPPVRITLPDGTTITGDQSDLDWILSQALNRQVTCQAIAQGQHGTAEPFIARSTLSTAEEYWPDMAELDYQDTVIDFDLPPGTFFDGASVHLLTTATLDRLRELYPAGRFEVPRFRPNIVVETPAGQRDFVENAWIGRTLAIGEDVRLRVTSGCPRCVMTTLPQGDLPLDYGILRTAAQHNRADVGVYASVLRGGIIHRGDVVTLA